MILPTLLHPKSIGEITLQSADPFVPPSLDPHYYEHPEDVKLMMEGLRVARKIGAAKGFSDLVTSERVDITLPGGDKPDSDEYLLSLLHKHTVTVYHQVRVFALTDFARAPSSLSHSRCSSLVHSMSASISPSSPDIFLSGWHV